MNKLLHTILTLTWVNQLTADPCAQVEPKMFNDFFEKYTNFGVLGGGAYNYVYLVKGQDSNGFFALKLNKARLNHILEEDVSKLVNKNVKEIIKISKLAGKKAEADGEQRLRANSDIFDQTSMKGEANTAFTESELKKDDENDKLYNQIMGMPQTDIISENNDIFSNQDLDQKDFDDEMITTQAHKSDQIDSRGLQHTPKIIFENLDSDTSIMSMFHNKSSAVKGNKTVGIAEAKVLPRKDKTDKSTQTIRVRKFSLEKLMNSGAGNKSEQRSGLNSLSSARKRLSGSRNSSRNSFDESNQYDSDEEKEREAQNERNKAFNKNKGLAGIKRLKPVSDHSQDGSDDDEEIEYGSESGSYELEDSNDSAVKHSNAYENSDEVDYYGAEEDGDYGDEEDEADISNSAINEYYFKVLIASRSLLDSELDNEGELIFARDKIEDDFEKNLSPPLFLTAETYKEVLTLTENEITMIEMVNGGRDKDPSKPNNELADFNIVPSSNQCMTVSAGLIAHVIELGGPNLGHDYIQKSMASLDMTKQLDVFIKLTQLVYELHVRNFVHCDISPDNIVISLNPSHTFADILGPQQGTIPFLIKDSTPIELYRQFKIMIDADKTMPSYTKTMEFLAKLRLDQEQFMMIDLDGTKNVGVDENGQFTHLTPRQGRCNLFKESYHPRYETNSYLTKPDQLKTKDVFALGFTLLTVDDRRVNKTAREFTDYEAMSRYRSHDEKIKANYNTLKLVLKADTEENRKLIAATIGIRLIIRGMQRPNYMSLKKKKNRILRAFPQIKEALLRKEFDDIIELPGNNHESSVIIDTSNATELAAFKVPDEEFKKLPERMSAEQALKAFKYVKILFGGEGHQVGLQIESAAQVKDDSFYVTFITNLLQMTGLKDSLHRRNLVEECLAEITRGGSLNSAVNMLI